MTVGQFPPLWLVPERDESVPSIIARLAERNGLANPRAIVRQLGLRTSAYDIHGQLASEDLSSLEDACRLPVGSLSRNVVVKRGNRDATICGVRFDAKHVRFKDRRWCPKCLADAPYHRRHWDLLPFVACPDHAVRLTNRCSSCGATGLTLGSGILSCSCGADLRATEVDEANEPEVRISRFILMSIEGAASPHPVMVPHDLAIALPILTKIGLLQAGGFRSRMPEPSDLGLSRGELAGIGLEVISGWPHRFLSLLDGVARATDHAYGLRNAYGWFWDWVGDLPSVPFASDVAQTVRGHAARSVGVRSDHPIHLSDDIDRSVTLAALAHELDLSQTELRNLAGALKVQISRGGRGRPSVVGNGEAIRLRKAVPDIIDTATCRAIIGVGRSPNVLRGLLEANEIVPLVRGGGSARDHRFLRSDIVAWLEALAGAARTMGLPHDHASLLSLASDYAVPLHEICAAVRSGKLRVVGRREDAVGVDAIVVPIADMRTLVRNRRPYATVADAARVLGVDDGTVIDLCHTGELRHEPKLKKKSHWKITSASLDELAGRVVRGEDYADQLRMSAQAASKHITSLGVASLGNRPGRTGRRRLFLRTRARLQ